MPVLMCLDKTTLSRVLNEDIYDIVKYLLLGQARNRF
jgi:hypothetical protein